MTDLSSGAVGPEIVKQSPSSDLSFSRLPVTVKKTSAVEPTSHGFHMAVNHIAGSIGIRIIKGQNEGVCLGTQFSDGIQRGAGQVLSGPGLKVSHLLTERGRVRGVIDVPGLLLDEVKQGFELAFTPITDFEKGVQKAFDDYN